MARPKKSKDSRCVSVRLEKEDIKFLKFLTGSVTESVILAIKNLRILLDKKQS